MTTFIDLTNRLLKRLNEVEIAAPDFGSVIGVRQTAKDATNDAIRDITASIPSLQYVATNATQVLVPGQEAYPWPANFIRADWDSFYIQRDNTLGITTSQLKQINRTEWFDWLREDDEDTTSTGRELPRYVADTQDGNYVVTPSPDKAYTLKFKGWTDLTTLSAATDNCIIPSRFDPVILLGGLYYMYLFRDNGERTQMAEAKFKQGLRNMKKALTENPSRMVDTRILQVPTMAGGYGSVNS